MNTYMVTKTLRYPSLFSEYAQISCHYPYTSLLHNYLLPPIIKITALIIILYIKCFFTQTKATNLPQFTKFLRQTHIHRTIWGSSEELIKNILEHIRTERVKVIGQSAILKWHRLTTLEVPLAQRKTIVRLKTKHWSLLSRQIFFLTFTCGVWYLCIDKISNHSWWYSQSTVPFSVHPVHMISSTSPLDFTHTNNT